MPLERSTLVSVAGALFARAIERGDVDVFDGNPSEFDLAADNWTLRLEGLPDSPWGFLAIDDEPDDPAEFGQAIAKSLGASTVAAFVALDRDVNGELSAALARSGDALSKEFVTVLSTGAGSE